MDEKEELLKKDRERQKKREALREKREQELKKKVRLFYGNWNTGIFDFDSRHFPRRT